MSKEVTVPALPDCDICKFVESIPEPKKAEYDFKTTDGRWANGCHEHYIKYRMYRDLGTGKGQHLVTKEN